MCGQEIDEPSRAEIRVLVIADDNALAEHAPYVSSLSRCKDVGIAFGRYDNDWTDLLEDTRCDRNILNVVHCGAWFVRPRAAD